MKPSRRGNPHRGAGQDAPHPAGHPNSSAAAKERLAIAKQRAQMCRTIEGTLSVPFPCPDEAVRLSSHIPFLLEAAAEESTSFLLSDTQCSGSSSTSAQHASRTPPIGPHHFFWQESIDAVATVINALNAAQRLPQQQVLDAFTSPDASAPHVAWMEDLAGRILQYRQQGNTSSSSGSTVAGLSWLAAPRPPTWRTLADELLRFWGLLSQLHSQCVLAATAAATGATVGPPGTGHGRSSHSSGSSSSSRSGGASRHDAGGRSSSSGSGSKQTGAVSRPAPHGGSFWNWYSVVGDGSIEVLSAVALQVQAAWLGPNLLRLMHVWLLHAKQSDVSGVHLLRFAYDLVNTQLSPAMHPAVVQRVFCNPGLAAVAAGVGRTCTKELQDLAWGYLATGNHVLREVVQPALLRRSPRTATLLHPTLRRCPPYHRRGSYAAGVSSFEKQSTLLPRDACRCVQRLIAAELWELWPWQLEVTQQLRQLEQEEERQQQLPPHQLQQRPSLYTWSQRPPVDRGIQSSTAASTTTGSSSSSGSGSGSSGSGRCLDGDLVQDVAQPLLPQMMPLLQASSSSSRRHWPAPPACRLPPVKQQQLQLALEQVCVTVELSPQDTRSGLLLLVLLLLRAEPPLRLAFLQGPWGGLLLAALQLYACGRTPLHEALEAAVPGLAADQSCGLVVSQQIGGEGLVEGFRPHSVSTFLSTEGSAAWLLNWLLLQPQGSCDVTSTSESSSSSVSACSRSINATSSSKGRSSPSRSTCVSPHNSSGSSSRPLGCGPLDPDTSWRATPVVQCGLAGCKAGALPCIEGPASHLQLLPGYTPDLQLLATLETLLSKGDTEPCALLAAIAASWQDDPSRAPPPDSPMWLALASMAVGVRKAAAAPAAQSLGDDGVLCGSVMSQAAPAAPEDAEEIKHLRCFTALLPLLQLAVLAVQQPKAGWGALVLGAAVQGAALACCGSAVGAAWDSVEDRTVGTLRVAMQGVREAQMATLQQSARTVLSTAAYLVMVCDRLVGNESPAAAVAPTGARGAAAGGAAAPHQAREARFTSCIWLLKVLDLLRALSSSWPRKAAPTGVTAQLDASAQAAAEAAEAAWRQVASLPADSTDGEVGEARRTLQLLACVMDVCNVASRCARACGGAVQLLGCAHLGCTTRPPGGLASCEASLGVNRRGSVCGGCGVVRYCGAACAQRDWPEHRRVCRRLAAAAACRRRGV